DTHLWTPVFDLSASFWHQSVVERTTKRTTRSTNSAAIPTGRDGSRWIPKEWTVAEFAPVHKLTAFLTPIGRVLRSGEGSVGQCHESVMKISKTEHFTMAARTG